MPRTRLLVGFLATLCLCPADLWANPCSDVADPTLKAERQALNSGGAPQWRRSVTALERHLDALEPDSDRQTRACGHYLAAQAHFFLSNAGNIADRAAAARALEHLWRAALADPRALATTQGRGRLKRAWRRMGRVEGWRTRRRPAPVALPQRGPRGTLTLSPISPQSACGGPCPAALSLSLPLPAPGAAVPVLPLGPGRYQATVKTACGERSGPVTLPLPAGPDPWPAAPECRFTPVVVDTHDGSGVDQFTISDASGPLTPTRWIVGGPLTVAAQGYLPTSFTPPEAGGEVKLGLVRCEREVEVETIPPDAVVTGAEPGPWGERQIIIEAPGHLTYDRPIDVGPRCDTPHALRIELAREIAVVAEDAFGNALTVSKLTIAGEPRGAVDLALVSGHYKWRAYHPDGGEADGVVQIPACPRSPCAPFPLKMRFPEGTLGASDVGPPVALSAGGALLLGGVLSGLEAMSTQGQIDDYTTRNRETVSIDELIDERDSQLTVSNALTGVGAALLVTGVIWYLVRD